MGQVRGVPQHLVGAAAISARPCQAVGTKKAASAGLTEPYDTHSESACSSVLCGVLLIITRLQVHRNPLVAENAASCRKSLCPKRLYLQCEGSVYLYSICLGPRVLVIWGLWGLRGFRVPQKNHFGTCLDILHLFARLGRS